MESTWTTIEEATGNPVWSSLSTTGWQNHELEIINTALLLWFCMYVISAPCQVPHLRADLSLHQKPTPGSSGQVSIQWNLVWLNCWPGTRSLPKTMGRDSWRGWGGPGRGPGREGTCSWFRWMPFRIIHEFVAFESLSHVSYRRSSSWNLVSFRQVVLKSQIFLMFTGNHLFSRERLTRTACSPTTTRTSVPQFARSVPGKHKHLSTAILSNIM